jgi:formylglycine-generating enzyme required for sulfatase activity
LKAKDIFKECEKCPEMVIIPAGQFKMGSIHGERGRSFNEQPRHEVTIGKMFAIGKLHVTVDQFRAFVTETGYTASKVCRVVERDQAVLLDRSWNNPNFVQTDLHPVVCITKRDAQSYIDWLRKKTGKHYRLLSEAEWEYAARAGTTTRYYFGDDEKDICRYGNSRDMRARRDINDFQNAKFAAPCDDGYAYTSPVGSFSPNDFGLYDMLGNASTFVEDCWNNNYIGAPIDGSPWKSGYCVENTVARGGNWIDPPDHTRSASRINQNPLNASAATGLRVARSLEP